ncbi:MAG TPA: tetratricopeptide repeat protein [Gemmatimonadales bacterium]|nr:tetratricopeptide repeat protein [Gemmatimonadales bacterium]
MKIGAVVLLLGLLPAAAVAQDSTQAMPVAQKIARAMRAAFPKFEAAQCSADKGLHFKVSSAKVYLKTAVETPVEENKARALDNGERVASEAISQNGQDKSAGAWYYLGRIELRKGNVTAADSALSKAVAIAPDCADDVAKYRRAAWVPVINQGIDFLKAKQADSATTYFELANRLFAKSPHAYYYLATMAFDAGNMDRALVYFDSSLAVPADTADAQLQDQATFNKAVVLLRMNRGTEAVPILQKFTAEHPDDINAKKALMSAYQAAGQQDSVNAVAAQLEAAGESVQRTAAVDTTPFNAAVTAFNEERWADAAAAAEKVAAAEPYNRDAVYMLVASYYRLKKGPELVRWGKQLIGMDPGSEAGLQMLGFGYNLTNDSKDAVATRLKLNGLPVAIGKPALAVTPSGATFTATATGRDATNSTGKAIPAHPVTLTVEFVNKDGAAVSTSEVTVPALKAGETFDISAAAQGAGIASWRYTLK